jgi:hypothetical protein
MGRIVNNDPARSHSGRPLRLEAASNPVCVCHARAAIRDLIHRKLVGIRVFEHLGKNRLRYAPSKTMNRGESTRGHDQANADIATNP